MSNLKKKIFHIFNEIDTRYYRSFVKVIFRQFLLLFIYFFFIWKEKDSIKPDASSSMINSNR